MLEMLNRRMQYYELFRVFCKCWLWKVNETT